MKENSCFSLLGERIATICLPSSFWALSTATYPFGFWDFAEDLNTASGSDISPIKFSNTFCGTLCLCLPALPNALSKVILLVFNSPSESPSFTYMGGNIPISNFWLPGICSFSKKFFTSLRNFSATSGETANISSVLVAFSMSSFR